MLASWAGLLSCGMSSLFWFGLILFAELVGLVVVVCGYMYCVAVVRGCRCRLCLVCDCAALWTAVWFGSLWFIVNSVVGCLPFSLLYVYEYLVVYLNVCWFTVGSTCVVVFSLGCLVGLFTYWLGCDCIATIWVGCLLWFVDFILLGYGLVGLWLID